MSGGASAQLSARERFARNMRLARHARGLSQEGLAESCGLHRTYVSSVERGERNISIDNMEKIALALELDLRALLSPEPYSPNAS